MHVRVSSAEDCYLLPKMMKLLFSIIPTSHAKTGSLKMHTYNISLHSCVFLPLVLLLVIGGDPSSLTPRGASRTNSKILVEAKRWRSLSCPTYCSKNADPVCGSDGVIYMNDCERRKKTCNQNIAKVDIEECTAYSGSKCEHKCTNNHDMVCGDDGRTYLNKCYLQAEYCERGVQFSHFGSCTNTTDLTKEQCYQDLDCSQLRRSDILSNVIGGGSVKRAGSNGLTGVGPVCGSDGNVYGSECDMKKRTCGQGVVPVDRRHCKTTKHCDSGCWRISRLTCGSDGKLYNNGCQMHRKNCGKHVYEVPVPFCLNRLYRTECPLDCSTKPFNPICGSDGNIYNSVCEMKKLTCGFPLTRYELVTTVDFKKCDSKAATCAKLICPKSKISQLAALIGQDGSEKVCGNDGSTYESMCELRKATCTKGIQMSHPGPCVDLVQVIKKKKLKKQAGSKSLQNSDCPKHCSEDTEENLVSSSSTFSAKQKNVICASDGNTYRSECDMRRRTCGQLVVVAPLANCEATRHCSSNLVAPRCPRNKKHKMICGSDNQFYSNECQMKRENCGKHMHIVPIARCLQTFQFVFTGCSRVCPTNYEPVCGSDNKTYSNSCFMEMEKCRGRSLGFRRPVSRKYFGKCGEQPLQKARNYLYR